MFLKNIYIYIKRKSWPQNLKTKWTNLKQNETTQQLFGKSNSPVRKGSKSHQLRTQYNSKCIVSIRMSQKPNKICVYEGNENDERREWEIHTLFRWLCTWISDLIQFVSLCVLLRGAVARVKEPLAQHDYCMNDGRTRWIPSNWWRNQLIALVFGGQSNGWHSFGPWDLVKLLISNDMNLTSTGNAPCFKDSFYFQVTVCMWVFFFFVFLSFSLQHALTGHIQAHHALTNTTYKPKKKDPSLLHRRRLPIVASRTHQLPRMANACLRHQLRVVIHSL